MTKGQLYHEEYERTGLTYVQIAAKHKCERNAVAAAIYGYRQRNGIKISNRNRKAKTARATNFSRKYEKKERQRRVDALSKCFVRPDGVLQCPTMRVAYPFERGLFE